MPQQIPTQENLRLVGASCAVTAAIVFGAMLFIKQVPPAAIDTGYDVYCKDGVMVYDYHKRLEVKIDPITKKLQRCLKP